jgi:hypothetical protein
LDAFQDEEPQLSQETDMQADLDLLWFHISGEDLNQERTNAQEEEREALEFEILGCCLEKVVDDCLEDVLLVDLHSKLSVDLLGKLNEFEHTHDLFALRPELSDLDHEVVDVHRPACDPGLEGVLHLLIQSLGYVIAVGCQFIDGEQVHLDIMGVFESAESWNLVGSEESHKRSVCHCHFIWGQVLEERSHGFEIELEVFFEDEGHGVHDYLAPEPTVVGLADHEAQKVVETLLVIKVVCFAYFDHWVLSSGVVVSDEVLSSLAVSFFHLGFAPLLIPTIDLAVPLGFSHDKPVVQRLDQA